jgi:hypothetical protein
MEPLISLSRRELIRAGALGLTFLANRAVASKPPARSLITVWLEGGPSQLETWDPHPRLSQCGAIPTSVPGLSIAELYPRTAEAIRPLSVIRSLTSKEGDHERGTYAVKTGHRPEAGVVHPALGAIACRLLPPASSALPPYVTLGRGRFPARAGFLGARFDPFRVAEPGTHLENLEPEVPAPRQARRLEVVGLIDQGFAPQAVQAQQETRSAALALMSSPELGAFRLDDEPARVRQSYGSSPFGKGCLVARRLLERGVRAIEVTLSGFDSHARNLGAHRDAAGVLDGALASLLRDLVERELLQHTLVLVIGEFGRTPKINVAEGRDHWPHAFPCLIGGAGLQGGQVIGETDPAGAAQAPKEPVPIEDLTATVLAALGLDPTQELQAPSGRPIPLSGGSPLRRLLT